MSKRPVFVFGSNLAGRHGAGAALHARQCHGAVYGVGEGLQNWSYAIPTKDAQLATLPLDAIQGHVERFLAFARSRPELTFQLTRVGCGLAGYQDADIVPLFAGAPGNVVMPAEWCKAVAADELGAALTGIASGVALLQGALSHEDAQRRPERVRLLDGMLAHVVRAQAALATIKQTTKEKT